uniref:Uncharacterized protein n=1 Tax=Tetranychus urticae TaxID=32264 RepID=T1KWP3_TETUR
MTLKELGCAHILVTNACGSTREEFKPDMINQIETFNLYKVINLPQAHPFNKAVLMMIEEACRTVEAEYRSGACIVACEGPRDIIGITTVLEYEAESVTAELVE